MSVENLRRMGNRWQSAGFQRELRATRLDQSRLVATVNAYAPGFGAEVPAIGSHARAAPSQAISLRGREECGVLGRWHFRPSLS